MFLSSVTRTAGSERGDQTIVARDLTSSASALVAYTPFLVSASATLRSMTLPTLGPVFQISSSIGASSTAKLSRRIAGETYQGRLRPGIARCLRTPASRSVEKGAVAAGKATGAEHFATAAATEVRFEHVPDPSTPRRFRPFRF